MLALVSASDAFHAAARATFEDLTRKRSFLSTTSYVLVETYALLGRRFGIQAVEMFRADFAPILDVIWVDEPLHEAALDLLRDIHVRDVSLVDAVSFVVMRRARLDVAFTFDAHFASQGFETLGGR